RISAAPARGAPDTRHRRTVAGLHRHVGPPAGSQRLSAGAQIRRGVVVPARMTDVVGFLAYLLLPLIGIAVWRLDGVRKLALEGRLAIAGAAGALIAGVTMAVMPVVGVHWSRTRLVVVFGVIVAASIGRMQNAKCRMQNEAAFCILHSAFCISCIPLGLTLYGLLTARETCGDLLFFWGPKGV